MIKYTLKLIVFVLILITSSTLRAQDTLMFLNPGDTTYTIPQCVTEITVHLWGGSGAGSGFVGIPAGSGEPGGGGGGGGYSSSVMSVTPGQVINMHIGAYGENPGNDNGGAGEESWFLNQTTLLANGGSGATGTSGGAGASAGVGDIAFGGGNGGAGADNAGGGGGSTGSPFGNGVDGQPGAGGVGGAGGASIFGSGGKGGDDGDQGTFNVSCFACGGGGGGGRDGNVGGYGSGGMITVIVPTGINISIGSSQTICPGTQPNALSVTPTGGLGTGYEYEWIVSTTSSVSGYSSVPGATDSVFTPSALSTTSFFKGLINNVGCALKDTSVPVVVVVEQIAGTVEYGQTICTGNTPDPLTLTIHAQSLIPTVSWESAPDSTGPYSVMAGETVTTLILGAHNSEMWYRAVLNAPGCTPYNTQAVPIKVSNVPATCNAGGPNTIYNTNTLTLYGSSVSGGVSTGAWSVVTPGAHTLSTTDQTTAVDEVTILPDPAFDGQLILELTTNPNGCGGSSVCQRIIDVLPSNGVGAVEDSIDFLYTGAVQTWENECAEEITVRAWGAGGGGGGADSNPGASGGGGGYIESTIPYNPGEVLNIFVGQGGLRGEDDATGEGGGPAGWGGNVVDGGVGGNAGGGGVFSYSGGGGGGASGSGVFDPTMNPLVVAGGGGGGSGGGNSSSGGAGGGGGVNGQPTPGSCENPGLTGSMVDGIGGTGAQKSGDGGGGGGGGGGYRGGTGGGIAASCDCGACGGGGGSSYSIPTGTDVNIINGNGTQPGNAGMLPAGLATGGGAAGDGTNGYLRIKWRIETPPPPITIGGSTEMCPGDTVTITDAVAQNGIISWTVLNGTGTIIAGADTQTPTYASTPADEGTTVTLQVEVIVDEICYTDTSTAEYTIDVGLTMAGVLYGDTSVCVGDPAPSIMFTGQNGTPNYTFTYNINNGTPDAITSTGGSPSTSITAPTTTAGTYTYYLTNIADAVNSPTCAGIADTVTVIVTPTPTATISGDTTICQNDSPTNIIFTGADGLAPYTFDFDINGNPAVPTASDLGADSDTILSTTNIPGTNVYTLSTVTDANGCSAQLNEQVTINIVEPVSATISGNDSVCLNAAEPPITFSATAGVPPFTFTYNIDGGSQITVAASGNDTFAIVNAVTSATGSFVYNLVGVTDGSGLTCGGAGGSATIVVTSLPSGSVEGDTLICEGAAQPRVVFRSSTGTAPYIFTYAVDGNQQAPVSSVGNADSVEVLVATNPAGLYTYELLNVQDANTCSQVSTASASVEVAVPSQATVVADNNRVCQDQVANVIFTGFGGPAPYTIVYTTNVPVNGQTNHTALTGAGDGDTISVAVPTGNPQTIIYTITSVTDNLGLSCGAVGQTDTVVIDPLPQFIVTANTTETCLNEPDLPIVFSGTSGTPPYTFNYSESINGGAAVAQPPVDSDPGSNSTTVMIPADVVGTKMYSLGQTQGSACQGNGGNGITLTIHPLPAATVAVNGNAAICETQTSGITFTATAGTPPFTFTYNINGSAPRTLFSNTASAGLTIDSVPGSYTINLTGISDENSCTQTLTETVTIDIDPLPTAVDGMRDTICMNGNQQITTASITNGTINWTEDGAGTLDDPTQINPTYTAGVTDANNTVQLDLVVSGINGCVGIDTTVYHYINVDSLPLAIAGGSATICENATHTVSGVNVRYGSILWDHDGAGSLTNPTSPTPIYTAAAGDAVVTLTVTVTSDNSCASQTATAIYTINVDPIPTATAGGMQTICENATATVAGAALTNGTPNWAITNGSGTITGETTLTPTYTASPDDPNNSVILTMTVTSDNSCSPQTATAIYTVNVDPIPTAIAGGTQAICENGTATLSGATSNYGTILWTHNGTGTITAGETTLTPTYTAATGDANNTVTMTLTVTSNNTCAPQTATAAYTVDVAILPTATSTGTQTICENGTATVSGAVATDGNILWSHGGAGTISDETTLTPAYNAATGDAGNTVTLTMTVTSNNACTPQSATATYIVNVDKLPIATAGGNQIICQAGAAIVSGAAATDGTINWTENGSGSITAGSTSLTPTYTAGATDAGNEVLLTMTVTSDNMCNPQTAIDFYSIEVKSLLTGSIALSNPATCQGTTEQVTFTGGMGTAPYTFTYSVNGGADQTIATITGDNISIAAITATNQPNTYQLIKVKDIYCENAVSDSRTMIVHPLPTATMEGLQTLCADSVAQPIIFRGENGNTPYTFHFSKTDLSLVSSQLPPLTATGSDSVLYEISNTEEPGIFTYVLDSIVDSEGCSSYYSQDSSTLVTIKENPEAQFSVTPEQTSILEPAIELNNSSYGTDLSTTWQWDFGDNNTSIDEDPFSHSYADTGTYIITLMVSNDTCSSSAQQTIIIEAPILVYIPTGFTPNGDGINDEFKPKGDGLYSYEMKIYDRWGNMIFYTDDIDKGWNGTANGGTDLAQIDSYVYVINIIDISKKQSHTYRGVVNLVR